MAREVDLSRNRQGKTAAHKSLFLLTKWPFFFCVTFLYY
jgi:hypothetical protein